MISLGNSTGPGYPALIIAEIGTGYSRGIDYAYTLIEKAASAGADCAKFQVVFADEIVHPNTGNVNLPGGPTPLYRIFKDSERDAQFFQDLKRHTESLGLVFLASPFGIRSARILRDIGSQAIKIASPELNHFPLLSEVSTYGIPVLVSSGVSTIGDIEQALRYLPKEIVLLHCITQYPAPVEEYNIRSVETLAKTFGRLTGISDHSIEPALVPALSVIAGAAVIEKHFTLGKDGGGLDDPVALTPDQFAEMTGSVRTVESLDPDSRMPYLYDRFGKSNVLCALGDGVKGLAPSERENYLTSNRSILAIRDIHAGEVIDQKNVALLRSEKNLEPGLSPEFLPLVSGRRTVKPVSNGSGIKWDDLLT